MESPSARRHLGAFASVKRPCYDQCAPALSSQYHQTVTDPKIAGTLLTSLRSDPAVPVGPSAIYARHLLLLTPRTLRTLMQP